MSGDFLGPLMFVVVFLFIFAGYPVAFSLGGTALIFAVIGIELGLFSWNLLYAFPERVFGVMSNGVLLAVPFFIFMGTMPREVAARGGPSAHDRDVVRPPARRSGSGGGHRRRHAAAATGVVAPRWSRWV